VALLECLYEFLYGQTGVVNQVFSKEAFSIELKNVTRSNPT
jgi:hypothetical protein